MTTNPEGERLAIPEYRNLFPGDGYELRIEGDTGSPRIVGYAAVWDQETELYPGFREVVRKGAFAASLGRDDVLGLFEHREDKLLARSSAGTLELAEDEHGLRYTMTPRSAAWIREDVLEPIRRRELRGSSFGFYVVRDEVTRDGEGPGELRELLEVQLIDVSPVARPAYVGTDVGLRSRAGHMPQFVACLRRQGLTEEDIRATLDAAIAATRPEERKAPEEGGKGPGRDYYRRLLEKLPPLPAA